MNFADIKKGAHAVLKETHICKLVQVDTSKTGKHGVAKKVVVGLDVTNGNKIQEIIRPNSVLVPVDVSNRKYQFSHFDENGDFQQKHCVVVLDDSCKEERLFVSKDDVDLIKEFQAKNGNGVDMSLTVSVYSIPDFSVSKIISVTNSDL